MLIDIAMNPMRKQVYLWGLIISALFSVILIPAYGQKKISLAGNTGPEIGIVEHTDTLMSKDIKVVNEKNDTVSLFNLLDKPTILNLVYYRCPGICSPIMNSIAEVISKMDMTIGKDYQVITVSFDYRESTELALQKKANYLKRLKKQINPDGWKFFTADSIDIQKLTKLVGFKFKMTGNDYIHPGMIAIFSQKAKLTRYFYGTYYLPFEVKLALVEAGKGQSGPTINRVLQFCYSYDPQGRQYVLNITKISGILILFIGIIIMLVLIIKPKRK